MEYDRSKPRSIVVNDKLWDQVLEQAKEAGASVSLIVRELLKLWLKGEVKIEL